MEDTKDETVVEALHVGVKVPSMAVKLTASTDDSPSCADLAEISGNVRQRKSRPTRTIGPKGMHEVLVCSVQLAMCIRSQFVAGERTLCPG